MPSKRRGRRPGFKDRVQIDTENEKRAQILDFLRRKGPSNISQVAEGTGIERNIVRRHLNKLGNLGLVVREEYGVFRLALEVHFELAPFEKEVIESISKIDTSMKKLSFTRRLSPFDVGCVFLHAEPEVKNQLWSIIDPLVEEFQYFDPYWLRYIFRYALREKLVEENLFSGKRRLESLQDMELNKLWRNIFGNSEVYTVIFHINPKKLLEWLKTPEGREDLQRALPEKIRKELYDEALRLWQEREAWNQRLKPLEDPKDKKNDLRPQ